MSWNAQKCSTTTDTIAGFEHVNLHMKQVVNWPVGGRRIIVQSCGNSAKCTAYSVSSTTLTTTTNSYFLAAFLAKGFFEIAAGRLRTVWSSAGGLLLVLVALVKGTGLGATDGGWASLPGDFRYGCCGAPSCTTPCVRIIPVVNTLQEAITTPCSSPDSASLHARI